MIDTSPVSCRDVNFEYRSDFSDETVRALSDISFQVEAGQVVVLCGASGSGKSTMIRLLNGLIPHMTRGGISGEVTVAGQNLSRTQLCDIGRISATVFQNPRTQFFADRVIDELAYCGENYGHPPEEILDSCTRAAQSVGISHLLHSSLHRLSGGELQKVACASALAAQVDVIFFDEPTSNLSPQAIEEFADILRTLKEQGKCVLIAEHRLYFLRGIADRVLLMEEGRLAWDVPAEQFYAMGEAERRARGLRSLTNPNVPLLYARDARGAQGDVEPLGERRPAREGAHRAGLSVENLHFSYGQQCVLTIPHLSFPRGCVTAVIGENGVGKTTLVRLLCGLASPDAGQITWEGQKMNASRLNGLCALVMQDVHRQLFARSVDEELSVGNGTISPERRAQLLEVADLTQCSDRHPLSLSGGQKQRLVIAAAAAAERDVIIFDEPTSGVDARHLTRISQQMRHLAEQGAAVIVVTHDGELVDECADVVIRLEKYCAERDTTPLTISERGTDDASA